MLILFFVLFNAAFSHDCDRQRSRQAREVITKVLESRLKDLNYVFPEACPLNVKTDLYFWQEQHKASLKNGYHKCRFCGKVFETEGYLDHHMNLRHSDAFLPNATNCLGDLCPLLNCDIFSQGISTQQSQETKTDDRMKCEMLMHRCFPAMESQAAATLYHFALQKICDSHSEHSHSVKSLKEMEKERRESAKSASCAFCILLFVLLMRWCFHESESLHND